jgi:hypothetical protein
VVNIKTRIDLARLPAGGVRLVLRAVAPAGVVEGTRFLKGGRVFRDESAACVWAWRYALHHPGVIPPALPALPRPAHRMSAGLKECFAGETTLSAALSLDPS